MLEPVPARLLGMSGSLRSGSYSNAVLETLREKFEGRADLRIYDLQPIPAYNQDFEGEKRPAPVKALLAAIAESDGLVLCAPEFNHSIPGVLKNALDWASRPAFTSVTAGSSTKQHSSLPVLRSRRCCAKFACGGWPMASAVSRSHRARGRLSVDAAQQLPIAEQVARPHLADREPAVAAERLKRKVSVKTDMASDPSQPFFDQAQQQIVAGEVIDDNDRATGDADPAHFRSKARRVGHYRGDVERQHCIEGAVGKLEVLGVHHLQVLDVGEAQVFGSALSFCQHLGRDIDPGHSRIGPEMRQRQTGTNPNFENPLPRTIIRDAHGVLASGVEHRTKNKVVGAGKQAIGPDRIVQIHRLALV